MYRSIKQPFNKSMILLDIHVHEHSNDTFLYDLSWMIAWTHACIYMFAMWCNTILRGIVTLDTCKTLLIIPGRVVQMGRHYVKGDTLLGLVHYWFTIAIGSLSLLVHYWFTIRHWSAIGSLCTLFRGLDIPHLSLVAPTLSDGTWGVNCPAITKPWLGDIHYRMSESNTTITSLGCVLRKP